MYSFDISNGFSSIPILETIDIYTDFLYRSEISPPAISEYTFVELRFVVTSVKFSFNDIMSRQIDGVSMGTDLGPTMANIFVGFYENNYFLEPLNR